MLGIDIMKRVGGGTGGSSGAVSLQDDFVSGQVTSEWIISYNGYTYERINNSYTTQKQSWISPQIGMNLYQVRATLTSGNIPAVGTLNTWQSLADTARFWGWVNQTSEKNAELLIEIRRASDLVVVDSANISIYVAGLN